MIKAINANIYDPTGGRVSKNLIIEIDSGNISISERDEFYKKNSVRVPEEKTIEPINTFQNLQTQ